MDGEARHFTEVICIMHRATVQELMHRSIVVAHSHAVNAHR